jgi:glycosyltransferase involved in cell wall biosynthesis
MRIGIDVRCAFGKKTGVGYYTYNLLKALFRLDRENDYLLFFNSLKEKPEDLFRGENLSLVRPPISLPNRGLHFFWRYLHFPKIERFTGPVEVFHSPNYQLIPTRSAATVITVYDVSFLKFPEVTMLTARLHYARKIFEYVRGADLIIAISENTKNDLLELTEITEDKIYIVPGACDERFRPVSDSERLAMVKQKYGVEGDFILFVGTIEPRKNLVRLLRSYHRIRDEIDAQLLLVGTKGWRDREIYETYEELQLSAKVKFLGYVPEEELPHLYSGALFFVYPSIYEGFGLPPLEAISCGCPVISSDVSSLPEVLGEAALYVNPEDESQMAEAMLRLYNDPHERERLSELGLAQSKMFSWEERARMTLRVYEKARQLKR